MRLEANHLEKYRIAGSDFEGAFSIPCNLTNKRLYVVCGTGLDWDHVSVSLEGRIPLWVEMCFIKDLFFEEHETVIQFHPPKYLVGF